MDKAVYTAQINKHSVVCYIFNYPFHHLPFLKGCQGHLPQFLPLTIKKHSP